MTASTETNNDRFDNRMMGRIRAATSVGDWLELRDILLKAASHDNLRLNVHAEFNTQKPGVVPALQIVEASKASGPVFAQAADLPGEALKETFFLVEVMTKKKTVWRKELVVDRIRKLRAAGHLIQELHDAYTLWCKVRKGETVSTAGAQPTPDTASPPQETAHVTPDAVAFGTCTNGPETGHQSKGGNRRKKKPKADAKRGQSDGDKQLAPAAKPAPVPLIVLRGTSHPNGEPVHSPFTGALAAFAALAATASEHAESVVV
jgi:hypothetical protein